MKIMRVIVSRASCVCGGRYMWMKEKSDGVWISAGCICHNEMPEPDDPEMFTSIEPEDLLRAVRNLLGVPEGMSIIGFVKALKRD